MNYNSFVCAVLFILSFVVLQTFVPSWIWNILVNNGTILCWWLSWIISNRTLLSLHCRFSIAFLTNCSQFLTYCFAGVTEQKKKFSSSYSLSILQVTTPTSFKKKKNQTLPVQSCLMMFLAWRHISWSICLSFSAKKSLKHHLDYHPIGMNYVQDNQFISYANHNISKFQGVQIQTKSWK